MSDDPPAPRTRPKNRRAITIAAATELFARRGYQQVSVAEIARATNVGSSAIFRHFPTKSALLVAAIRSGLEPLVAITAGGSRRTGTRLDALLAELAEYALDHRQIGVLWQRESRSLDAEDQRLLRAELRGVSRALADAIRLERPALAPEGADLLAWCTLGALVSVGFHSLELPRERYVRLLVQLATTIAALDLPDDDDRATETPSAPLPVRSRRDSLVLEATALFAERGFGTVAVDDIGSRAGIAGPSIYSHFPSKQKLLMAAIERGNDVLQAELADALARDEAASDTLRRLVASYVGLAVRDGDLIRIVLSEAAQLDDDDRAYARRQQREYIDAWTRLMLESGETDAVAARIRVQAVLLVISDASQTPHLRAQPGFEPTLRRIAGAMLGIRNEH